MSVSRLNGVQLLVLFCSNISVVLFDNPGISKCLNMLFLMTEQIYVFTTIEAEGSGSDPIKLAKAPPPHPHPMPHTHTEFITDHSEAVLLMWCFLLIVM